MSNHPTTLRPRLIWIERVLEESSWHSERTDLDRSVRRGWIETPSGCNSQRSIIHIYQESNKGAHFAEMKHCLADLANTIYPAIARYL